MLLLTALVLQIATPAQDVVVTARKAPTEQDARRQVEAVLPTLPYDQPLARFTGPVCPGVTGLTRSAAQAVVDRIGAIAAEAGLAVGEPGCRPNLLVAIVPDGRATVRRLVARRPGVVAAQTLADVRRIVAEPGTARAWVEAEVRSRDGDPLMQDQNGGPPTLQIPSVSRASLSIRRDIVSAVVVIDAAGVAGRDTTQIADYAAMRGLADARPGRIGAGESILAAFTPDDRNDAPRTLTALDRGILHGLYSGRGNRHSSTARGAMVSRVLAEGGVGDGR